MYPAITVVAIGDDKSKKEHSQPWLWYKGVRGGLFAGRGHWLVVFEFSFAGDGGDDLAAVEATVFDEDAGGLQAADDYAGEVNSWDVAFECFGIERGTFGGAIEVNARLFEEIEIGVITGQREDLPCRNGLLAAAIFDATWLGSMAVTWV